MFRGGWVLKPVKYVSRLLELVCCAAIQDWWQKNPSHPHIRAVSSCGTYGKSRKHKTCFKSTVNALLSHCQGCWDVYWRCLLLFIGKKTYEGRSSSITLLWSKSGQITFFFSTDPFLAAPIFPGCFLKRKSGRSATVLARGEEAEEEVVKASHLLLYRRQLWRSVESGLNDRWRWI